MTRWTPSQWPSLDGCRILVTGASAGIGAGLAEEFARRGAVVGICARREARLAETFERCRAHSPRSRMWVADLADPAAVEDLARRAAAEMGGVDVVVNNAGIPKRRHVTRLDASEVEAVMAVNFMAPVRLTLALLPDMVDRGFGRVVNISSVAATLSSPGESAYDASKAALSAFSESMAVDLWDSGVRVMAVYPGLVDTELCRQEDNDPVIDAVDPIPVSDVVTAVLDGLARDALQVYIPDWFEQMASGKAADVPAFLAGAAEFVAARQAAEALPVAGS